MTTAYANRTQELKSEIREAEFVEDVRYSIEGQGFEIASFVELQDHRLCRVDEYCSI